MFALAGAGTAAADWYHEHPQTQLFVFLTDNQSAIRNIAETTDHPAQLASIIFRKQVDSILSSDATTQVEIRWVPGHKGYPGNERADSIAKAAVNDPPITHSTITWAREKANHRATKAWRQDWNALPHTNQTAIALKNTPPTLQLAPALRQSTATRDVQTRHVSSIPSPATAISDPITPASYPPSHPPAPAENQLSLANTSQPTANNTTLPDTTVTKSAPTYQSRSSPALAKA
jgi:hypothetical protein